MINIGYPFEAEPLKSYGFGCFIGDFRPFWGRFFVVSRAKNVNLKRFVKRQKRHWLRLQQKNFVAELHDLNPGINIRKKRVNFRVLLKYSYI